MGADGHDGTLRPTLKKHIDTICDRFEVEWKAGKSPRIEEYLTDFSQGDRAVLLHQLLPIELDYRGRNRERPQADEYLARFPEHGQVIDEVFQGYSFQTPRPEETVTFKSGAGSSDTRFRARDRIGRYNVEQELGSGACGSVYLAHDDQLQRSVAVKVPRLEAVLEPDRYVDEARTLANLSHPCIVPVYDAGRLEDGTPFVVMKHIEGESLKSLLQSQRPSAPETAELMSKVAEAVHHAHKHGFIHRDLKPSNILLDKACQPYVADFGLALHEDVQHQYRGDASGTPAYRAPEQVRGQADWMDGRCDIWALGVILYEALTGRRPFETDEEITDRSPKPLRQIDDTVPEDLERICLRCLSKSPDDRYPTADGLANDLRRVIAAGESPSPQIQAGQDALGNTVISGQGNVVIIQSGGATQRQEPESEEIGPNPYRGLAAFHEHDAHLFFGREEQVARLWDSFRNLHEGREQRDASVRFLPILGPSGCGKSSLARAGLIAELARRPLPGWKEARVAVLSPGVRPVESLAAVMARIATGDSAPVAKSREFEEELKRADDAGEFTGLRRIAAMLPDISGSPVVILVDQFEEVYSLCDQNDQRAAFIENLLCAASDPSRHTSVVITLRSDFLGQTQDQQLLNSLISTSGLIVPAMTEAELHRAIAEPARLSGHCLEDALVDLLIRDSLDREGALPLLQFALTRIWEGFADGTAPSETLRRIGGVGGALAGEAQRIYERLDEHERTIARRVFLGLVQLGEGTKDTRRRTSLGNLVVQGEEPDDVRRTVSRFSTPGARLIAVSADSDGIETAEVTHEALFEHWETLRSWVASSRDDVRFHRRLGEAAQHWVEEGRPDGLLWRSPDLELLRGFRKRAVEDMTSVQLDFFYTSDNRQRVEQRRVRRRVRTYRAAAVVFGLLFCVVGYLGYETYQNRIRADATSAKLRIALYASEMDHADQAWNSGDFVKLSRLLSNQQPQANESDLRGFEWYYLSARYHDSMPDTRYKFGNIVNSVAFFPDGRHLAVGLSGHALTTIDMSAGTRSRWNATVNTKSAAVSPDGRFMATGEGDPDSDLRPGWVRIRDLQSKAITGSVQHDAMATAVTFCRRKDLAASGSADGVVHLWTVPDGTIEKTIHIHEGTVASLEFSPDDSFLVTASWDRSVKICAVDTGNVRYELPKHETRVTAMALSPNGQLLATAGLRRVRLWRLTDGGPHELQSAEISVPRAMCLAFSPDGGVLAVGSVGGTVTLYQTESFGQVARYFHTSQVTSMSFSPNGDTLATGGFDKTVRLWRFLRRDNNQLLTVAKHWFPALAVSRKGALVASSTDDNAVIVWTPCDDHVVRYEGHTDTVTSVAFSPVDKIVASASYDKTVRLWDVESGKLLGQLDGHRGPVWSVAFSPDGKRLASAGRHMEVKLWDVAAGAEEMQLQGGLSGDSLCAVFSSDGRFLAAGQGQWTKFGQTKIWDLQQSPPTYIEFDSHPDIVYSVAFSPKADTVAVTHNFRTGEVRLFDRQTGDERHALLSRLSIVSSVEFSPDGRQLVTSSADGALKFWDPTTGKEMGTLRSEDQIRKVVFFRDGDTLATAGEEGRLRLWRTTAANEQSIQR